MSKNTLGIQSVDDKKSSRDIETRVPARTPVRDDEDFMAMILSESISDRFYYDKSKVPEGIEYEWKRLSITGMEDRQYQAQCARLGWTAVPSDRHPERGQSGETIIEGGQILMERSKRLNDLSRNTFINQALSREQKHFKDLHLSANPNMPRLQPGQVGYKNSRDYAPVKGQPIPE